MSKESSGPGKKLALHCPYKQLYMGKHKKDPKLQVAKKKSKSKRWYMQYYPDWAPAPDKAVALSKPKGVLGMKVQGPQKAHCKINVA